MYYTHGLLRYVGFTYMRKIWYAKRWFYGWSCADRRIQRHWKWKELRLETVGLLLKICEHLKAVWLLGTWRLVTLRNTSELETKVHLENFGFTVQCHDTRVVQKLKIKTVVDFKCELLHHLHTESRPAVSICFCISRNSWQTRSFSKTNSVRGLGCSGRSSVTSYFRIS